ncbi:hypothetical protein PybrP1_006050 [[Pythium] brassicae (nom. inval.)]|nr:hypothetical protein PybrP1_006050 [[Pythium] brassicae (nom. inval.)]
MKFLLGNDIMYFTGSPSWECRGDDRVPPRYGFHDGSRRWPERAGGKRTPPRQRTHPARTSR